jgi:hypothetical protein
LGNRQNRASEGEKKEGKDSVKGGEISDKGRESETETKKKKISEHRTREQNTWGNLHSIDFFTLANFSNHNAANTFPFQ